MKNMIIYGK
jgi:hypothetical protein